MITPADLMKKLPRQKIITIKNSGLPSEASHTAAKDGHKRRKTPIGLSSLRRKK
tara:strand:- start:480 stop:641 length:162 start_codon:yes stop_codon:yes gene_type:complete